MAFEAGLSRLRVSQEHLQRLHPRAIGNRDRIRQLLVAAREERAVFRQGMNQHVLPEQAILREVNDASLTFSCRNFDSTDFDAEILLRFELGGRSYFFSTSGQVEGNRLLTKLPPVIYAMERRDRPRTMQRASSGAWRVAVQFEDGSIDGEVRDFGPGGMAVVVPSTHRIPSKVRIRVLSGPNAGFEAGAVVLHRASLDPQRQMAGLSFSAADEAPVRSVQRNAILPGSPLARSAALLRFASSVGTAGPRRLIERVLRLSHSPGVEPVHFVNSSGENLVGLVDAWGKSQDATAVVVPPAWGRTKETLLPLARTIVSTFRAAGQPVVVLRFDGTHRRGESFVDPTCRKPGTEYHRFTFSQAVRDIQAAVDFVDSEFRPKGQVLVTFSAASIDGRKAVVFDRGERIKGWVSVVGSADLQSLIRVISGGIDYVGGIDRGLRFGIQQILGVEVDIDRAGIDALEHDLAYLEESRRDFDMIKVPVTWYHGRFDAWMDRTRVADVLSHGDTSNRVLVEVPTGHQLRSSAEALKVFQAVASEIGEILPGRRLSPRVPSINDLAARQRLERGRRKARDINMERFWHDYLVGADETVGIDLMASTFAYRDLMSQQADAFAECRAVLDLGCGVGNAIPFLASGGADRSVTLLDFVPEALVRARNRALREGLSGKAVRQDLSVKPRLPFDGDTFDGVLASLLLSYVPGPEALLREIRRVLRPGGILVASTLRLDADISQVFQDGLAELRSVPDFRNRLGRSGVDLPTAARNFLNEAAKLLEYEEEGAFRFWDDGAFRELIVQAGFVDVAVSKTFGSPPQAIVISARRPSRT